MSAPIIEIRRKIGELINAHKNDADVDKAFNVAFGQECGMISIHKHPQLGGKYHINIEAIWKDQVFHFSYRNKDSEKFDDSKLELRYVDNVSDD